MTISAETAAASMSKQNAAERTTANQHQPLSPLVAIEAPPAVAPDVGHHGDPDDPTTVVTPVAFSPALTFKTSGSSVSGLFPIFLSTLARTASASVGSVSCLG